MALPETQTIRLYNAWKEIEADRTNILIRMEKQITDHYGAYFVNMVGLEIIRQMPVVSAEEVNLSEPGKYVSAKIDPNKLKHITCRGLDGFNRPFIIIKTDLNLGSFKTVKIALIIFKFCSIEFEGKSGGSQEDNYATALENLGSDGKKYDTPKKIYSLEKMTHREILLFKDLLIGRTICGDIDEENNKTTSYSIVKSNS